MYITKLSLKESWFQANFHVDTWRQAKNLADELAQYSNHFSHAHLRRRFWWPYQETSWLFWDWKKKQFGVRQIIKSRTMANRSRVWIKIKFSFSSRRVLNFSKRKKYHERRKRRFEIFVLLCLEFQYLFHLYITLLKI